VTDAAGHEAVAARAQARASARVHGAPRPQSVLPVYAGFVTRALAFALDAVVINVVAITVGVVVGLGLSILNVPDGVVKALAVVGGAVYVVWSIAYFVTFWSTTGQTPGSRLMRIRVRPTHGVGALKPRRACLRLIGLTLAAIPLCAGFVPILLNDRRRGFQDWLARTVVVYEPIDS